MENFSDMRLQILKTKVKLYSNCKLSSKAFLKSDYETMGRYRVIINALQEKLNSFHNDLIIAFNGLEVNAQNVSKLRNISELLMEFNEFDFQLKQKINKKILDLKIKKEEEIKKYNFKEANVAREEIIALQEFNKSYNPNNHYKILTKDI